MRKMLPENKIIRGLWIGDRLTNIQRLSIQSFLDNGHDYHLYTYGPRGVQGLPGGAIEYRADDIAPWTDRAKFRNDANFSDWFRSNLTWKLGGWYVDTDIVCLAPFDFDQPRVFVSEYQFGQTQPPSLTKPLVNGCIIKIPAKDAMTGAILDRIKKMDTLHCGWIDVGPAQYRWGVDQFNYRGSIQPPDVFDSLWPSALTSFCCCPQPDSLNPAAKAIHLRTSYWQPGTRLNPDGKFFEDSWFEQLKRKHGVENAN